MLGRPEVEVDSGEFAHLGLEAGGIFAQFDRVARQALEVDGHSGALHSGKHRDQRGFEVVQHRFESGLGQLGREGLVQAPGHVGVFGGVLGHFGGGHVAHALLVFAFGSDEGIDRNRRVAQVVLSQCVHAVALVGLQEVVGEHGVAKGSDQLDAVVGQDLQVKLQVVANPGGVGTFEVRTKEFQPCLGRIALSRKRHVVGRMGFPRERKPDHFSLEGVKSGGFGVKGDLTQAVKAARKGSCRLDRVDKGVGVGLGCGGAAQNMRRGGFVSFVSLGPAAKQVHLGGISAGGGPRRGGRRRLHLGRGRSCSGIGQQAPRQRTDFELVEQGAQRVLVGRFAHEVGLVELDGGIGQNRG